MRLRLHIQGAGNGRPQFEHQGPTIFLGRAPTSTLSFASETTQQVSWEHARIDLGSRGAFLSDLGSTNGTFLNGQRVVTRVALKVGDQLRLGQTGPVLKVVVLDLTEVPVRAPAPAAQAPVPAPAPAVRSPALAQAPPARSPVPPPSPRASPAPAPPAAPPQHHHHHRHSTRGTSMTRRLLAGMERRERRVFLSITLVLVVLVCAVGGIFWELHRQAGLPSAVHRKMLHSTVWVWARHGPGEDISLGTGALIDREHRRLLTAYHVVAGARDLFVFFPAFDDRGEEIADRAHYVDGDRKLYHHARLLDSNPELDLALLELDSLPDDVQALPLAPDSPRPGEQVHALGNPGSSKDNSLWVAIRGTVRQLNQGERKFADQTIKARMIETEGDINQGDSGAPLVNDRCQLVGVCSNGAVDGKTVNYCIDIQEVKKFLKNAHNTVAATP